MPYLKPLLTILLSAIFFTANTYAQKAQAEEINELLTKAKQHWGDTLQLQYLNEAATLATNNKNHHDLGIIYQQMGSYYYSRKPEKCIDYQLKAHDLLMMAGNKKMAAICYHSIGFTYEEQLKDYQNALVYIEKSLPLHQELKDTAELANMYKYMGYLKGKLGRYEDAGKDAAKALSTYNSIGDDDGVAVSWFDLATIYSSENKNDSAILYYNKAKTYWNENCAGRVFLINNKMIPLYIQDRPESEVDLIKENEDLLKYKMHHTMRLPFYKLCIDHYTRNNDKQKAEEYTTLHKHLVDSLNSKGIVIAE